MDIPMAIRSFIFFIAGIILIFFPNAVFKFQSYVLDKMHIKHNLKSGSRYYTHVGIIFIIISIILFALSIAL